MSALSTKRRHSSIPAGAECLECRILLSTTAIQSGATASGTLALGQTDTYTFTASAGAGIEASMGATGNDNILTPHIDLFGPDGTLLKSADAGFDGTGTTVSAAAPSSGTYSIVARDSSGERQGAYNIAVAVAPGMQAADPEGGAIVSGQTESSTIAGNLHVYTFAASAGAAIEASMGATGNNNILTPHMDLFGPDGTLLKSADAGFDGTGTALSVAAPSSGTYFVVARDSSGGRQGTYNIAVAVAPGTQAVGPEGGAIISGQTESGTIAGNLHVYTFAASAGAGIEASMGATGNNNILTPHIDLFGPDGTLLKSADAGFDGTGTTLSAAAPSSGVYFVVARDSSGERQGAYNIAVAVAPGTQAADPEGGAIISGQTASGTIAGNLHVYTFTASAGAGIEASMGATGNNNILTPHIDLFGPAGTLLKSADAGFDGTGTTLSAAAPSSGIYFVVARDSSGERGGTYNITVSVAGGSGDVVAPAITSQPQPQTVSTGGVATFSVAAGGTAPLSYQWQFNGASIPGANGPTLTLNGASSNQAGAYSVLVSNSAGSVTSSVAQLRVTAPQPVALPPQLADSSFNGGSPVSTDFVAEAVAVQPDGKVVLAGHEGDPASPQAVLERLNSDGTTDTSFGSGGKVVDPAGSNDAFFGVLVEPGGSILASGTSGSSALLARYDSSGDPDPSLGGSGRVISDFGGSGSAAGYGLALDPRNGDIVVAGSSGGSFAVERIQPDGSGDPSFDSGQPMIFNAGSAASLLGSVAVESDGSIVGVGATGSSVAVVRLLADGTPDAAFSNSGTPGISIVPGLTTQDLGAGVLDNSEGVALEQVGGITEILVANRTPDGHFGVVRLGATGQLDPSFGNGGVVESNFGGNDDADTVSLTPDGSTIVVTGTSASGNNFASALLALNAGDGFPDTSFNPGGQLLIPETLPAAASIARPSGTEGPDRVTIVESSLRAFAAAQSDGRLIFGFSGQNGTRSFSSVQRAKVPAQVGTSPTPTPTTPTPTPTTPTPTPTPTGTSPGLGVSQVLALVPTSVVGGSKKAHGTISIVALNNSSSLFAGPVTFTIVASTGTGDISDVPLAQFRKVLRLKPGKSKAVKAKVKIPAISHAGSYFIKVTASGTGVSGGTSVAQSSGTIQIS